ncbi:hypothetical protein [Streptococcus infantis]|uniref:hypothetical protein n=1 Tax=Streptococcus infantis TaxID=68892 RepID=UPI0026E1BC54|nr:hypothetical protein [Streptococcus infantis]MDO6227760.1 hypothetical protein [Streptococcus infantis]
MIEDEIRKKRQRIEECEDDYRRSYKRIENQYEEANYKFQQLRHMIDEKHRIISHTLDQLGGDTTEWRYQSNQLASNFSQQIEMAYRNRQGQLEQAEMKLEQEYKRQHRILEDEFARAQEQQRRLEERGKK